MPEQSEDEDSKILPLIDRRAPILDRIRKRNGKKGLSFKVGKEVGAGVLDEELFSVEETAEIENQFRLGIADELGVNPESINDEIVERFSSVFKGLNEESVLTEAALAELGIKAPEEEEEEETDEEEESVFD